MKTCRYAVLALLGVLITLTCLPLFAQEIPVVNPGDRVRVTYGYPLPRRLVGTLLGVEPDAFLVSDEANRVSRVRLDQVQDLQLRRGQRRHPWKGLGIGVLSGVVIGAGLGLASGDDPSGWVSFTAEEKALFGGAVLGAIGGVTGLVIGSLVTTDKWQRVDIATVHPFLQFAPDGSFGLHVSIPLRR